METQKTRLLPFMTAAGAAVDLWKGQWIGLTDDGEKIFFGAFVPSCGFFIGSVLPVRLPSDSRTVCGGGTASRVLRNPLSFAEDQHDDGSEKQDAAGDVHAVHR